MGLAAYLPLEQVYAFHEVAETWILRRYSASILNVDGERVRDTFAESPVPIFRDRRTKSTTNNDAGQNDPRTCTAYTRTRLVTTDEADSQPADVLFDPKTGDAWQATSAGDWDESLGFAVTLTHCGRRGQAPWA